MHVQGMDDQYEEGASKRNIGNKQSGFVFT